MSESSLSKLKQKNPSIEELSSILREEIYSKTKKGDKFPVQTYYARKRNDTFKCVDVECLAKHFDVTEEDMISFMRPSKFIVGKEVKKISKEQRYRHNKMLKGHTLKSLVAALNDGYSGENIKYPAFTIANCSNSLKYNIVEYLADYYGVTYSDMKSFLSSKGK